MVFDDGIIYPVTILKTIVVILDLLSVSLCFVQILLIFCQI